MDLINRSRDCPFNRQFCRFGEFGADQAVLCEMSSRQSRRDGCSRGEDRASPVLTALLRDGVRICAPGRPGGTRAGQSTGMIVPVSLQTPAVALGAVGEPPDLHRIRPCEGRKSGVQAGMHRCSRSGRTYEPLTELLQQQAGLAAGRSWHARLAVWKVGGRRTEVTKMRKTSLGRLLAVARCARSARSGDSLRYATGDPTMADQPPTRLTIGGAIAGSA